MNSGSNTNCAPCLAACSTRAVARFRLASMSWSTDDIWITAIRSVRSVAAADRVETWTCACEVDPTIPAANSNAARRNIFIVVDPISNTTQVHGETERELQLAMWILNDEAALNANAVRRRTPGARIASGRWSLVYRSGRTQDLREDRLQPVRPDLIALQCRVQPVALVHQAVEETAVGVGEPIVDVEEPDRRAVGEASQVRVHAIDLGHDGHVVVARKNRHQHDRRARRLAAADIDEGLHAARDVGDLRRVARSRSDVVRPGEDDYDFRMDAVELAVLEPPQDVLNLVGAPAE